MGHEAGWFDWYVFRTFSVVHDGDRAFRHCGHFPPDAADLECKHGALPTDSRRPAGCDCWDG